MTTTTGRCSATAGLALALLLGAPAHAQLPESASLPFSAVPTAGGDSASVASAPIGVASRLIGYLWIVRTSLVSPAEIDRALALAKEVGVRGVLVQVVGRADAFFRSDLLPRAQALPAATETGATFDPLGYLVPRAQAAGLEVHAWMNCCLVWSAAHAPRDPRHVLHAHPEWIARVRDGRRMDQLGPEGYERLGVEGAYLSPAHAGVRNWVARIAREIADRYPVDGIHLDYIRQPGAWVGYDGATRAGFALRTGVDRARPGVLERAHRASLDTAFAAFQCEQVTAMVREVRDSLRSVPRPVLLSAAVKSDIRDAERSMAQAWPEWVTSGLVDLAFPMCYAPVTQTVLDHLGAVARRAGTERVVPGLAVYNAVPTTVAAHVKGARALGFREVAVYSLDALFARPGYWPALKERLTAPVGAIP
ncbi:MAG TPA: family 10 glycosylhydrolase [Candidatus Limnocylindria bacterium]|nr:family 10 glycosylhydrolase [Candidatus Limnocylindria bacterium]